MTIVIFIASLTLVSLCSGQEANASSSQPTIQMAIWRNLLAETEGLWTNNYPMNRIHYHISSYKRNNQDKSSKILIVGGQDKDNQVLRDTWIYTPWSNSWFQVATHPQFPFTYATAYEVLPSLCSTLVILIQDENNVWIFDGSSQVWNRHLFHSQLPVEDAQHDIISKGAVALDDSNCTVRSSSCRCTGSVFFYSTSRDSSFLNIRELRCVTQQRQLRCQWTHAVNVEDLHDRTEFYRILAATNRYRDVVYFASLLKPTTIIELGQEEDGHVCVDELEHKTWRYRSKAPCWSENKPTEWHYWLKVQPNMAVWKDILLLFYEFPHTLAVSLENDKQYSGMLFNSPSELITSYNTEVQTIFTTPSSEIVRFYWERFIPVVSLYK